jgi:hypothetical protein
MGGYTPDGMSKEAYEKLKKKETKSKNFLSGKRNYRSRSF